MKRAMAMIQGSSLNWVEAFPGGRRAGAPIVVSLHGRGADAGDLADLAPYLDQGAGLTYLFPQAPRPFEAMPGMSLGYTWFDGWPPSSGAIADSRTRLLAFLDEIQQRFKVDDARTILAGFSQGGLMSIDCGFRRSGNLAGIAVMSGGIHEAELPDLAAHREQNILIVHGTADEVIPVIAARRARHLLQQHGLEPEYEEFAMGHEVSPESLARVADFIHRALASDA